MRSRTNGFTLIEVLSATLILSGTILGFVRIMGDNLSASRLAEQRMISILLAEGYLEKIKGALYADSNADVSGWSTDLGNSYRASRQVTSQGTYLKEIVVQVGYDTSGNNSLDSSEVLVTLTTQYAKRS